MTLGSCTNIKNASQFNSPSFLFFKVLQEELGNWRSSNYSAISREFADNARFVFRSLEERSLHGNYIIDRLEGNVTDSLGARQTEQVIHFMTFPLFARYSRRGFVNHSRNHESKKATQEIGGSFLAATQCN